MISSLSPWQWFKLINSFILFFSPGFITLNFYKDLKKISLPMRLVLAFGVSLGFWILLLIWLQLFNFSFNSLSIRILYSLLFIILLIQLFNKRKNIIGWVKNNRNYPELLIIILGIMITFMYLYFYRDLVAGMGSDSMHHTLISSLFIENGQIPEDYGPYAPVITFSYHFGFHAFIAAMSSLSGIAPRLMVVISGAILMGLVTLAGGALVYYLTQKTLLGVASGAIIGIIYIFPSYSLIWGRYTQLMGTIMLMIYLLALFFWDNEQEFSLKFSPLLILITIGFIFSHYRIVITGIIFTIIYLLIRKKPLLALKRYFVQWLSIPLGALMLSSPWLIQLFIARQGGYEAVDVVTKDLFFSLDRLGPLFHNEPQTWILICLSGVSSVLGIIKKDRIISIITIWIIVLALITQPALFGHTLDPVTTIISSYVAITLLICLAISILLRLVSKNPFNWIIKDVVILAIVVGIFFGVNRWTKFNFSRHTFVTSDDLTAANWIKSNTDPDSLFMINTYQFPINDYLIIGLDGGYWLPVIAERQTVVPPMGFLLEKLVYPNAQNEIKIFHQIKSTITGTNELETLREFGVDYVYYSSHNAVEDFGDLIKTADNFELVYQINNVEIYKLIQ